MYVSYDVISAMDAEVLDFTTPSYMPPMEYLEAIWNETLRCSCVYDEYVLKKVFIEGLHVLMRHGISSYRSSKKNATVLDLATTSCLCQICKTDCTCRTQHTIRPTRTTPAEKKGSQKLPRVGAVAHIDEPSKTVSTT